MFFQVIRLRFVLRRVQQANCSGQENRQQENDRVQAIIGIGTEIIECSRIAGMIGHHQEHFTQRVFTEREIQYCSERKTADQHFAGRWAAKEAVLKALGTGWIAGISWTDVEVVVEQSGKPHIELHGGAARKAEDLGIGEVQISISHCKEYAVATAIAVPIIHLV
jgi:holo-[acyl-carrier protein] synthase